MNQLKNLAIIMDGNGRWAVQKGYPRFFGHVRGCKVVSEIVETAASLGLNSLSLYAFSTENWKRPKSEINVLFRLFKKFLLKEEKKLLKNNIRLKFMGDLTTLPEDVQLVAQSVMNKTQNCKKMTLILAVNYGAKNELLRAFEKIRQSDLPITEKSIDENLWVPEVPSIDLLIRTGGDQRISNFLLWQCAYSEFYFEQGFWPDFNKDKFSNIIQECSVRERRFGDVKPQQIEEKHA